MIVKSGRAGEPKTRRIHSAPLKPDPRVASEDNPMISNTYVDILDGGWARGEEGQGEGDGDEGADGGEGGEGEGGLGG